MLTYVVPPAASAWLQNVIEYCIKVHKTGPVSKGSNNSATVWPKIITNYTEYLKRFSSRVVQHLPVLTNWWASCSGLFCLTDATCEMPTVAHSSFHGYAANRTNFTVDDVIEVLCNDGYRFPHIKLTALQLVCHPDGTWRNAIGIEQVTSCERKWNCCYQNGVCPSVCKQYALVCNNACTLYIWKLISDYQADCIRYSKGGLIMWKQAPAKSACFTHLLK